MNGSFIPWPGANFSGSHELRSQSPTQIHIPPLPLTWNWHYIGCLTNTGVGPMPIQLTKHTFCEYGIRISVFITFFLPCSS